MGLMIIVIVMCFWWIGFMIAPLVTLAFSAALLLLWAADVWSRKPPPMRH